MLLIFLLYLSYAADLIQDLDRSVGHYIRLDDVPEVPESPEMANNMNQDLDAFCGCQLLC